MPGPDITRELRELTRARDAVAEQDRALAEARLDRAAALAERDRLLATGDVRRAEAAAADLARVEERISGLREHLGDLAVDLAGVSDGLVVAFSPETLTATLDGRRPVAMLPVRIETRYDGPTRLRVRVFPDQLHVDAHDPAFTAAETEAAQWYWTHRWQAGLDDEAAAREAWQGVTARFQPGRAAYLVQACQPTNAPPDAAPTFPVLPARANTWSKAPTATVLPDRLCVVGLAQENGAWVERFRQWGKYLPDELAVGPSPDTLERAPAPGKLPVDPGTAWMRDPEVAFEQGVLIDVEHPSLASGVQRLVVLGVDWTRTPEQAAEAVSALLEAQRYAGHLGFVPQGTPTNNTSQSRAGFTSDPAVEIATLDPYDEEPPGDSWSAGPRLATALGLAPDTFDGLPGSRLREHSWSCALTDALWRSTAGYYISHMLDPLAQGKPEYDADLREFARNNLFASGPLPVLRVDDQPLGILPVVARRYEPGASRANELVHRVASEMRRIVTPAIAKVPHLRRAGEDQDVDAVLLALLQRTPVPWKLRFRAITGPVERKNLSFDWSTYHLFQESWTKAMWVGLKTTTNVRLNELTHGKDHPLPVPLVLRPGDDPLLAPSYLAEIATLLSDRHGRQALNLRANSIALLEALAACSAVEEMDRAGLFKVRDAVGLAGPELELLPALSSLVVPTPNLVRIEEPVSAAALDFTSNRQLADAVVPQVSASEPIGEVVALELGKHLVDSGAIAALRGAPTDPLYWLGEQHHALVELGKAPPEQLEWAFRGYLDLFSSRIDAWFTALATERLSKHRRAAPTGVHIGCWGFVENLSRDVGLAAESLGFVHAPSLAHASSAAMLRNGRLANRGDDGAVFDLQVTSERVRRAKWLLEGVAQGQRLAALLGYRLERTLQDTDLQLMRYQMPMRKVAPLRDLNRPADEPVEVLAARDVVDGVALLDRWRVDPEGLLDAIATAAGDPAMTGADRNRLRTVFATVDDSYDAVSDLLVAESVHQAAVGNLERSGAALSAHDRHAPAPDLDFVGSPQSGHTITHRVALALQSSTLVGGWPRDSRGLAEPRLDAWVSNVLGAPGDWVFGAQLRDADGSVTPLTPITLADLGIGPLSVALATQRPGQDGPSELEQRIALAFADQVVASEDVSLELLADGLADLVTLGEWVAKLTAASPLTADDFLSAENVAAGVASGGTVDVADLAGRVDAVRGRLEAVAVALSGAASARTMERALLDAIVFDGPDASPRVPANHPDASTLLTEQVAEVSARLVAKSDAVAAAVGAPLPDGDVPQAARHVELLRALLGAAQPALPVWRLAAPAPVDASLAGRSALLQGDPTAVATWLQRSALVRPELESFASLLSYCETVESPGELAVVQQPHRPGASWHALPFVEPDPTKPKTPPHGSLGLVLHGFDAFDPGKAFAGLVVDGWTETVPADTETTAVTFHYDAPGARAPQSVLLAVHPEVSPQNWDFKTLLDTVNEAADLARLRTLSAAELAPMGSFLPALYLPDDYTRDVPSVSFLELIENAKVAGVVLAHADVLGKG
ncbi:MAG TPA: hypothetical protein VFK52_13085 [Nocardioidaceae bacterium]|nr:hypothetical protein [Nocardioidaceae bacterium]